MQFDFDRSGVVISVRFKCRRRSGRGGVYLFHHVGVGRVRVLRRQLRVEVRPEIGQHTGCVLLDFVGSQSGATEAVLAAEEEWKLRYIFAQHGVKFPGCSGRRPV